MQPKIYALRSYDQLEGAWYFVFDNQVYRLSNG